MKITTTQERTARVGQRRQVVIPREILETLKLRAGDLVEFAEQKNGVLIKPKRTVDPGDTLTPAEAKVVRRGEAQLKRENRNLGAKLNVRYRVELSTEAQKHLSRLPREVRGRVERAIDELEGRDDLQWSNTKALQGLAWRGRYRKRVGPYRIIFRKFPDRGIVEISAILIRSKDTYR